MAKNSEHQRPQDRSKPSRSSLSDRKTRTEIRKLELEAKLLEQSISPETRRSERLKSVVSLFGAGTGIAAILGLLVTVAQLTSQRNADRQAKLEERLDKALERVAANEVATQLSGVATLSTYLATSDNSTWDRGARLNIITALARMLSAEEKPVVRQAIADSFDAIPATDPGDRSAALAALVESSRSLVISEGLTKNRAFGEPTSQAELRAVSVGRTIVRLLRGKTVAADLAGIYCRDCDFSGLDLSDVRFDGAILEHANFTNSTLIRASFENADLEDTEFIAADLYKAKITQTVTEGWFYFRARRLEALINEQPDPTKHDFVSSGPWFWVVRAPKFDCANLRNADFSGYPLFGLTSPDAKLRPPHVKQQSGKFAGTRESAVDGENVKILLTAIQPSFGQADLRGADFRLVGLYGSNFNGDAAPSGSIITLSLENLGNDATLWQLAGIPDRSNTQVKFVYDIVPYGTPPLQRIANSLVDVRWTDARWPDTWKGTLARPQSPRFSFPKIKCRPRSDYH
ncbi:MAG: pipB2 [Alphaproteobacteria bacterium]|nr:pipB2 [Alphaproteobacteria bacterium]